MILAGSDEWYDRLMSARLHLAMGRAGVETLQELSKLTAQEFLLVEKVGRKTLAEATDQLTKAGLSWSQN